MPLSIVYITLNAEQYLEASLRMSRQLAEDIVIVDSGSSDKTLQIAKAMGCRVIHKDWLGFAAQKQLAIDSAKHDWVLFLDADEVLTEEAVKQVREQLSKHLSNELHTELSTDLSLVSSTVAYSFPRQNWFQGKWIKYGSWWPDRVVRLVNRSSGRIKPVPVHECWETNGQIEHLNGALMHYSYNSYSELIHKADRYSSLAAEQLFTEGRKCSQWSPLTHAIAAFIRLFLLKQGFRDGIEGAAIAYTTALASFMKYAKLQELWRTSNGS